MNSDHIADLQRFRGSAHARLHLGLLKNELHRVRTKRIVDGAERESVGVAALLGQGPLETVGAVHTDNSVLHVSRQHPPATPSISDKIFKWIRPEAKSWTISQISL